MLNKLTPNNLSRMLLSLSKSGGNIISCWFLSSRFFNIMMKIPMSLRWNNYKSFLLWKVWPTLLINSFWKNIRYGMDIFRLRNSSEKKQYFSKIYEEQNGEKAIFISSLCKKWNIIFTAKQETLFNIPFGFPAWRHVLFTLTKSRFWPSL